ncbi:MAG: dihydropteroate synthase, partial [Ruminiclostridium sp.]|nr:dihydropteroate synthase [Ruminiclostridium sp.]
GPKELMPIVKRLCEASSLPVIVMPNAGLPDPETERFTISAEEFSDYAVQMANIGVNIFGGCCGTTPAFIKAVVEKLKGVKPTVRNVKKQSAVCSGTRVCCIDEPRIIGERINPTGKKLFKEALKNDDINYILNQAIEQVKAGADILDVNVGLPDIDEKAMMIKVVKSIQGVTDLPLQIDSTSPEVIEAALRIYNGKAIVNSVNGEEESLDKILPIVKKYGAAVVGLTLDKNGIPKKAEQRVEIAKRIIDRALEIGIRKEDIYIDCLTLTASAEQEAVKETLKAVKTVKELYGVKTVLGVSNISFGLPNRELLNHIFLSLALENGLDLPIINPNVDAMTGTVRAFKLLHNIDVNSAQYIAAYSDMAVKPVQKAEGITLEYAIDNGLKVEAAKITEQLLKTIEPMAIINDRLIPALDKTGSLFESGKIFLPQLILSAGVAQSCFDVIKEKLSREGNAPVSKGKIVLATVKGDIHDIGKNIVKVLLENYGYTVIDLGKDVDYQTVVDAAIKHGARLVGLSALMTTTLKSMEETIALLKKNLPDCKVMVGGAVLTPDYAKKIGADYYAKDAKEAVDIARKIIG